MITVDVHDAPGRFVELLVAAESGDEVVIVRTGTPVVRLLAVAVAPDRSFGIIDRAVPETFAAALPEAELMAWE
jgi:prevent-host-death family protein